MINKIDSYKQIKNAVVVLSSIMFVWNIFNQMTYLNISTSSISYILSMGITFIAKTPISNSAQLRQKHIFYFSLYSFVALLFFILINKDLVYNHNVVYHFYGLWLLKLILSVGSVYYIICTFLDDSDEITSTERYFERKANETIEEDIKKSQMKQRDYKVERNAETNKFLLKKNKRKKGDKDA